MQLEGHSLCLDGDTEFLQMGHQSILIAVVVLASLMPLCTSQALCELVFVYQGFVLSSTVVSYEP